LDKTKARAIRLFMNESMTEFADRLGVAASTINDIEHGHRDITDRNRARLIHLELQMPSAFSDFYVRFKNNP
jgi:transcriptional regulator with XRE-family HTH domain